MMETQLVSVIVPIYKVERYLDQCIESIIAQTYRNLQILLVDDGSPDRCGEICEEYAKKDDRILVIHKENGGLSDARNAGIERADGEWLVFVDSDDFIDPRMVEILHGLAVGHQARMAWGSILEIEEEIAYPEGLAGEKDKQGGADDGIAVYSPAEAEKQFYTMNKQQCLVTWNKIYHKSLFQTIQFPKGKLYEDGYTTYRTIYIAEKVVTTSVPVYYYRQRKDSIMGQNSNRIFLPAFEAGKERLDFYREHHETELFREEINLELYLAIRLYQSIKDKGKRIEIKKWYRMFYRDYFLSEKWPLAKRIRMRSFLIGNPLYLWISGFEGFYNKLRKKQEKQ